MAFFGGVVVGLVVAIVVAAFVSKLWAFPIEFLRRLANRAGL